MLTQNVVHSPEVQRVAEQMLGTLSARATIKFPKNDAFFFLI